MNEKLIMSRSDYYRLEAYMFRLVFYTESLEWREMITSQKQIKILQELQYIQLAVKILGPLFPSKGERHQPIVGWKAKHEADATVYTVYRFSRPKIATLALDIPIDAINDACKINIGCKEYKPVGGYWYYDENTGKDILLDAWIFVYEKDWDDNQNYKLDLNKSEIKLL